MKRARGSLLRLAALCCAAAMAGAPATAAELVEVQAFGSNPGNLRMFGFVPPELPARAPLVVLAHGCLQGAEDIGRMTGWLDLAVERRFAIVLPQTSRDNEPFAGCFRTWLPEHQQRGAGEPLSIEQMIRWMLEHHGLDRQRVYITGLSSGGQLTNVMLATYPELFAAGAPQSATPYKCATSFEQLAPCTQARIEHTREEWGALALGGRPGYTGPRPRVAIWHGSADPLLLVRNVNVQMEQWTAVLGIDDIPDDVVAQQGRSRLIYRDGAGVPKLETNTVLGMGHAAAIDLAAGPVKCGELRPYAEDVGICAAREIADWFGIPGGRSAGNGGAGSP